MAGTISTSTGAGAETSAEGSSSGPPVSSGSGT